MSPSPSAVAQTLDGSNDYREGWRKLNRALREGSSWSGREPHSLFMNPSGAGRFLDASSALGFDQLDDGRALTPLDWDGDGDQDLCVTARTGPRFRLLDNRLLKAPRAVELLFEGLTAATVGARVELSTKSRETAQIGEVTLGFGSGRKLLRVLRAGEGYLSVDAAHLFFGLGNEDVASVSIVWPGGESVQLSGIDGPGRYFVPTGSTHARREDLPQSTALATGALQPAFQMGPVILSQPVVMPKLSMNSQSGGAGGLFGIRAVDDVPGTQIDKPVGTGAGKPVLLLLWASWCEPCIAELERLARDPEIFDGESLILALSLDELENEAEAFRLLDAIEWPGLAARATGETSGILRALFAALGDRRDALSFPAALVVDTEGAAVAFKRGAWSGPVTLPPTAPRDLRNAAALEPGRWLKLTSSLGGLAFDARLVELGLEEAIRERKLLEIQIGGLNSRAQLLVERGLSLGANGDLPSAIEAFEAALLLDPKQHPALYNLGVALDRLGRPADAARAFEGAVRLDPEDEVSWQQIARIALDQGGDGWQTALEALRRLGSPGALQIKRFVRQRGR